MAKKRTSPRLGDNVIGPPDTVIATDPAPRDVAVAVLEPERPAPFDPDAPMILTERGVELEASDLMTYPRSIRGRIRTVTIRETVFDHVADEPGTGRWIYREAR